MSEYEKGLEVLIKDLLSQRFPEERVYDVQVKSDVDQDGDKILRITLVVDENHQLANSRKYFEFFNLVMAKLDNKGSREFPLFNFASQRDMRDLEHA